MKRTDPIGQPLEDLTEYLETNRSVLSVSEPELVNRLDNLLIAIKQKEMRMIVGLDSDKVIGFAYTSYNVDFRPEKEEDPLDSLINETVDLGDKL